jgi:bifunctional DNA-binding transcriptional regulator/antitoxin component of YhaV-PrlF toxin-antitoxin module
MYKKKVLDDSKMSKGGVTIPKTVREKLSVKDVEFMIYLETRNKNVKIKKLEFDLDEKINLIQELKRMKLL